MYRIIKQQSFLLFITVVAVAVNGCKKSDSGGVAYRDEMRHFVEEISSFCRAQHPGFIIIPQNGQELVLSGEQSEGDPDQTYLSAIDGIGREELFYGFDNNDNVATPVTDRQLWLNQLTVAHTSGKKIMVTDYCSDHSKIIDSYSQNNALGFISFAAAQRELTNIPTDPATPYLENTTTIDSLSKAANFLYLINTSSFNSKQQLLSSISQTNFDLIIMDAFFQDNDSSVIFTPADLSQIRYKQNGGKRLLIAYMSIGEAEDYRYYWKTEWNTQQPAWMGSLNPQWYGNYKVKYWEVDWKQIICGNSDSYSQKIIDAGFDGVYLDIIDAFDYYENP